MGDTGKGAKAGLVAGVIYGIVLAVLSYFTVIADKAQIIAALTSRLPANSPFTPDQLYAIVQLTTPAIAAIGGIIGGLIVGAIYGKLYERIPGANSTIKGVIVGIILWLLISVLGGLGNLEYGVEPYLVGVGTGLLSALLFGFLLGYFYGRFSRPPKVDPAMQGL